MLFYKLKDPNNDIVNKNHIEKVYPWYFNLLKAIIKVSLQINKSNSKMNK